MKEGVFYQMSHLVKILVIGTLFIAILFRWNNYVHLMHCCIVNYLIGIIASICKKILCIYPFDQRNSFFAISSGTFCDKYSDWHTSCIHGNVNFGIEPPFVRLIP